MSNRLQLNCDEPGCGWSESMTIEEAVKGFSHAPCPKCGEGEILNEADLAALEVTAALLNTGLIRSVSPTDEDADGDAFLARINTRCLRG